MDIHVRWESIQNENAGVIMAFTSDLVKAYWRMLEEDDDQSEVPANKFQLLDEHRVKCVKGNYYELKCECAEFILEHTGIDLRVHG